jgi:hypothetical protein
MSLLASRRVLLLALVASLAFNFGLVGSRLVAARDHSAPAATAIDRDAYPPEFAALCDRLDADVAALRTVQAQHTRELADLMASASPDPAAIESCLDRLAATERQIKGAVVRTVLAQRDVLTAEQRRHFCNRVHDRLCTPYEGCASPTPCAPPECAPDQRGDRETHGGKHDS